MYKIIGKIDNFNPKKSYEGYNQPNVAVAASVKPNLSAAIVVAAKAAKHPSEVISMKITKRLKKEWKVSHPNHKDKLLTKFSCN